MSSICCITSCRKRLERNRKNIKSFSFPNDKKRRKLWITAVQNFQRNWSPSAFNRICNEHFKPSDFYTNGKNQELLLKTTAVPSIFLDPAEEEKQKKTRKTSFTAATIKHEAEVNYNEDEIIEHTEEVNPSVIEEYIVEEDPLTGNAEYKFVNTSKFYGQEEASDSDEEMVQGVQEHMEMLQNVDDSSLTLKLSKLISEENISSSCAEKLLSILKQHGHAELPKKTDELPTDVVEPENEEIDHMNKVLDYVAAEAKDIEAKMQFRLNFLSKCLNRIECKVNTLNAQPLVKGVKGEQPSFQAFPAEFANLFPVETIDKLMEIEDQIEDDENLAAKIKSVVNGNPRNWLKHLLTDELLEEFTLNGSGNKGNFMELKIIKFIETFISRGDILHQKRQCKDRYRKVKYKQRRLDNFIY